MDSAHYSGNLQKTLAKPRLGSPSWSPIGRCIYFLFCLIWSNYLNSGCFSWCQLFLLIHSCNFSQCNKSGLVNLCFTAKNMHTRHNHELHSRTPFYRLWTNTLAGTASAHYSGNLQKTLAKPWLGSPSWSPIGRCIYFLFCLIWSNYLNSGCFSWCQLFLLIHSCNFSQCNKSGLVNLCFTAKNMHTRHNHELQAVFFFFIFTICAYTKVFCHSILATNFGFLKVKWWLALIIHTSCSLMQLLN
jgi:hypothetical protein